MKYSSSERGEAVCDLKGMYGTSGKIPWVYVLSTNGSIYAGPNYKAWGILCVI